MAYKPTGTVPGVDFGQMAKLSIVLAGSAVAAVVIADYIAKRQPGERIAPGGSSSLESVERWLRTTADRMQKGSQSVIDSIDHRSK